MKTMRFNYIEVISTALILFITAAFSDAEMTTSQIADNYSPSVVTIIALDENDQPLSLGSGFFINANGDIATNHHVLAGCSKAIVKTKKGEMGTIVEILNDDPELDLLIASTSLKSTNPLPLSDSDAITVGEDIIAIGNPAGLEGSVSKGIISGIRKVDEFKFIQITAPISPGSSGGPVFNLAGKVIGIATAYLDYGQSLNFAMPINYLQTLKPNKLKLASLLKVPKGKSLEKDDTLVQVFDVHYKYSYSTDDLYMLDFP
jgi:S1-C subfamily serine protease